MMSRVRKKTQLCLLVKNTLNPHVHMFCLKSIITVSYFFTDCTGKGALDTDFCSLFRVWPQALFTAYYSNLALEIY